MATDIKIIKQILKQHRGMVSPAAIALGMTYQGLNKRIKGNKNLRDIRDAAREDTIDRNESVLAIATDRALKKKATAEDLKIAVGVAKFLLPLIAKHRGYVLQIETKDVTQQKKQVFKIGETVIEFGNHK